MDDVNMANDESIVNDKQCQSLSGVLFIEVIS
jgi:hypothetical protein